MQKKREVKNYRAEEEKRVPTEEGRKGQVPTAFSGKGRGLSGETIESIIFPEQVEQVTEL